MLDLINAHDRNPEVLKVGSRYKKMVSICAKMNFYEKLAPFMDEKENYKNRKLEEICKHVKYKKVEKGHLVFQENDTDCKEAYVILKGEVAVIRQPPKTTEMKLTIQVDSPMKQSEPESNLVSPRSPNRSGSISPARSMQMAKKRNAMVANFMNIQITNVESTPVKPAQSTQSSDKIENNLKAELFNGLESDMVKLILSFGDLIVRLKYGDIFGQFALQSNTPRSASVLAIEELHLMVIHRKEFDVIKEYYSSEFSDRKEFLLSVLPKVELISDIKILTKFLNSFEVRTLRKVGHRD